MRDGRPAATMAGLLLPAAILLLIFLLAGCDAPGSPPPPAPIPSHTPELKGFSYTAFRSDGFTRGAGIGALGDLQDQTGATWIALCVTEYQRFPGDTVIAPNTDGINPLTQGPWATTPSAGDIAAGVQDARQRQMEVMLKPHIDLYTGQWRAAILPDGNGGWFRAYESMLLKYARMAESLHVGMLSIGTELMSATQPQFEPFWRRLIAEVRSAYKGRILYAANWAGAPSLGLDRPEYESIPFWDGLDEAGIDAYYPLTRSADDPVPTPSRAAAMLAAPLFELQQFVNRTGKKVVITETGLQSAAGALASPWDFSVGLAAGASPDTAAQRLYYDVMIHTLGQQPWCAGMFWWHWESVPSAGAATDFTPRNKPAVLLVKRWYHAVSS